MPTFVEVNEAKVFATHSGSEWWGAFRDRYEPVGRITILQASMGGDRVRVACDSPEAAEWLAASMVTDHGLPKAAVSVVKPPASAKRYHCMHKDGLGLHDQGDGAPKRKKCSYCGGAFITLTGSWGVFTWTGTGRYPLAAAHATYSREAKADAVCEARPDKDWVTRWVPASSF